ncbi:Hypothetical protein FKW44_018899, partial [Caligus rogercresseyi]
ERESLMVLNTDSGVVGCGGGGAGSDKNRNPKLKNTKQASIIESILGPAFSSNSLHRNTSVATSLAFEDQSLCDEFIFGTSSIRRPLT